VYVIDTQIHMYLPDSPERPWPRYGDPAPDGSHGSTPSEILPAMDEVGVDAAAIVPAIWAGDDNGPALKWAQEHPERFSVMGRFDLWDPDRERIREWLDQPGMRGIRMSYPSFRGRDWLDVDRFPWFWAEAERIGIPLMLLIFGPEVKKVAAIAERHPGLPLIIDHMGLIIGQRSGLDAWAFVDDLFPLTRHRNVFLKFSAIPDYTDEEYPYPSLTPLLKQVVDAYGPDRLMWGSDTTRVLRASYAQILDHTRFELDFLSASDLEWILGRTAATVLNWPRPSRGWDWER